ncbi:MAG: ribonuclease R [Candidatus Aminicenantia bacterium]
MREKVFEFLKQRKKGFSKKQLLRDLNLSNKEKRELSRVLREMLEQGIIKASRNRFFVSEKESIIKGRYSANPNGYGFVVPEDGKNEDIFIPPRKSKDALHGDIVEVVCQDRGRKGKREGRVIRVVERKNERIIGFFEQRLNRLYIIPLDPKISREIALDTVAPFNPLPGMIVEAKLIKGLRGKLTEVFGYPDQPGVDLEVIVRKYNLNTRFSKEALRQAENIPRKIGKEHLVGREDFREKTIVTIDGETAKDFDDAVSVEKLSDGHYLLGVHIADVSYFVRPGTFLDREAFIQGNSVYFPEMVIPMLPERLSDEICSLKPNEVRLTFSVLMEFDQEGQRVRYKFTPSVIKSSARMTYTSVYEIFEGNEEERKRYSSLVDNFMLMKELARVLRAKRVKEGSLDFDLFEPELIYREGTLSTIAKSEQNEAHQVIEEFMLAANETVATFLTERNYPLIYRVHEQPSPAKIEKLKELLMRFGFKLNERKEISSSDLQRILNQVQGKPEQKFISLQILKSLPLARYTVSNIGHYGLAKNFYTHFTSPIRRYPDLVVHRILKKAIKNREVKDFGLEEIAEHCSQTERNAEEAERDLIEWRIIRFLRSKLGDELTGTIVDITKQGLVVELDEYFVEGLIHYTDLRDDFYFKKSDRVLKGKRKGKIYRLGDRVEVVLALVDPYRRRVFLTLKGKEK